MAPSSVAPGRVTESVTNPALSRTTASAIDGAGDGSSSAIWTEPLAAPATTSNTPPQSSTVSSSTVISTSRTVSPGWKRTTPEAATYSTPGRATGASANAVSAVRHGTSTASGRAAGRVIGTRATPADSLTVTYPTVCDHADAGKAS